MLVRAEFRKLTTTRLWLWMLPYTAGNALGRLTSVDAAMLGQAAGGLVLLAWALSLAGPGTRVAIRRDIT